MSDTAGKVVYLVVGGAYSDFHIEAVFDNEPAALEAVTAMNGGSYDPDYSHFTYSAYTLYREYPKPKVWHVKEVGVPGWAGRLVGDVPLEYTMVLQVWDEPHFEGRVRRGLGVGHYGPGHYRYWGTDRERVVKAFDDYHAQQLAKEEGIA
jgi:hypothetical protein